MADAILAATPCAHNPEDSTLLRYHDTVRLAELFRLSYDDYVKRSDLDGDFLLFYVHFLVRSLAKIEDIANSPLNELYQAYCTQFGHEIQKQFAEPSTLSQGYFESLILPLIQGFMERFHTTTLPESVQHRYQLFFTQLEFIFKNPTVLEAGLKETVENLFVQLRRKP